MADETSILIGGWEPAIPGCQRRACAVCGATVYIAPSGQDLLRSPATIEIRCWPCGLAALQADPAAQIQSLTPAQVAEIRRALRHRDRRRRN